METMAGQLLVLVGGITFAAMCFICEKIDARIKEEEK